MKQRPMHNIRFRDLGYRWYLAAMACGAEKDDFLLQDDVEV